MKIKRASGGDRKTTEQDNGTTLSHNSSKEKTNTKTHWRYFTHTHTQSFTELRKYSTIKWIGGGHMSFNSYNKRNRKKTAAKGFLLFKSAFVHIYMYLYMFFLAFLLSTHTLLCYLFFLLISSPQSVFAVLLNTHTIRLDILQIASNYFLHSFLWREREKIVFFFTPQNLFEKLLNKTLTEVWKFYRKLI